MKEQIDKGRQIYIICPMVEEKDEVELESVTVYAEQLKSIFPPDISIDFLHGKMKPKEKNEVMQHFVEGATDILVSTTVIEVGVDVPNASVMVIMSAERFGLSQLHQLRGRVGRGAASSHCILIRDFKASKEAVQRLELMCSTENGFEIAEEDMKMRGPGDLEGTQQSGLPVSLKLASLAKDGRLLSEARACAQKVLDADPGLSSPRNALLAEELRKDKYQIKDYSRIS